MVVPESEDRFTSLPYGILNQIISSLNIDDINKLSVLSKPWFINWTHFPVIICIQPTSMSMEHFISLVNKRLSYNSDEKIDHFRLACSLDSCYCNHIDSWILQVFRRKVNRLVIDFSGFGESTDFFRLPYSISHSLLNDLQKHLQNLKWFSLKHSSINSGVLTKLLEISPLEKLELVDVEDLEKIDITGRSLVNLVIRDCESLKSVEISDCEIESIHVQTSQHFVIERVTKLVDLGIYHTHALAPVDALSQLGSLYPHLEVLTLRGLEMEELHQLQYHLCHMRKLRRLVIEVRATDDDSLSSFISIICSCPCLKEFVLMLDLIFPRLIHREVETGSLLRSESLKLFEFLGFYGRLSDSELVLLVLNTASRLEHMIIDPRCPKRLKDPFYSESEEVVQARYFASSQVQSLRATQAIPANVNVHIR